MSRNTKKVSILLLIILIACGSFGVGALYQSSVISTPNSTVEAGSLTTESDYIVFTDGLGTYYARNATGNIEFESSNASYVIQQTIDNGGSTFMHAGNYTLPTIIKIDHSFRLSGVSRQWVGNQWHPNPSLTGTNLFYSGEGYATPQIGVLNISAINEVYIESLSIQGNNRTYPYTTMSGIEISAYITAEVGEQLSAPHGIVLRDVEITYFNIGIDTVGSSSTADSEFYNVKIEYCSVAAVLGGSGNFFQRLFIWNCHYGIELVGTATGTHGTYVEKSFINNVAYVLWLYDSNETEITFVGLWSEFIASSFLTTVYNATYESYLTVRTLTVRDSHFDTNHTEGYVMDFSHIVDGQILLDGNTFDNLNSHTISIAPPIGSSFFVMVNNWKKNADNSSTRYVGTENSGYATNCVNGTWVTHGLITTPTLVVPIIKSMAINPFIQVRWINQNSTKFQVQLVWSNGTVVDANHSPQTVYFEVRV